jgi:hypothetical protein
MNLGKPRPLLTRRRLLGTAVGLPLAGALSPARAGSQLEEPLADSVRSTLAAAIAKSGPPRPVFDVLDARLQYLSWLGAMSERLKRFAREAQERVEFLETVWYEATRAGRPPALVLGRNQVESGFRK